VLLKHRGTVFLLFVCIDDCEDDKIKKTFITNTRNKRYQKTQQMSVFFLEEKCKYLKRVDQQIKVFLFFLERDF
jgi:hypothetical protein